MEPIRTDPLPTDGLRLGAELPVVEQPRLYVCPGEQHAISRAIHLARLAAYYPKCRECAHRHDTGQLSRSTVGRLEQTAARVVQPSPFRAEGVRGEYLNHLTRQTAFRVAAALADRLWETHPLLGQAPADFDDDVDETSISQNHTRPTVVLGHDARPSSPDLCIGVSMGLRQMGCEVIDIGRVTAPCHAFAVDHLQADAGLFVTGSGGRPQWTGLDMVGPRGLPWSLGTQETGTLNDVERRYLAGVSRPTRLGGSQRYFDAVVPYRANLLKHFRNLRPLRIVCATDDVVLQQTLRQAFESLPCDLIAINEPAAAIDPHLPHERLTKQMRASIKEATAACGVAIADDGRAVSLFDERGRVIAASPALLKCITHIRGNRPMRITLDERCDEFAVGFKLPAHAESLSTHREGLASRLFEPVGGYALEAAGRLWIKDSIALCDAVLTIGLLLRVLSEQRQPASEVLER